jgi:hypothetical protein
MKLGKDPQMKALRRAQEGPQREPWGAREGEKRKGEKKTESNNGGPREGKAQEGDPKGALGGLRRVPKRRLGSHSNINFNLAIKNLTTLKQ